jgi:sugar O-acyltransferase (sialic acid O-acetyltransferase NeuD family)
MRKVAFFGIGGHAREVELFLDSRVPVVKFVDAEYVDANSLDVKFLDVDDYNLLVVVGDSVARKHIVEHKLPSTTNYLTFIHHTAIVGKNVTIGEGSYVGPYCIVTDNICLGKHTILNRGVQIGHDSNIGDYFSAMPGAIVSGNVTIGECVYLGTNASIREKITITDNVTIGLNAGVVHNINEPGTYGGVPAKKLK